jgi:hypothetical protein
VLTVTCWKWGTRFAASHVNVLRSMLARHLHADHRLVCITDDPSGLDGDIVTAPIDAFTDTPRCRRRMKQFDGAFADVVGPRFLGLDLDVVIVDDITPLAARTEPIVCWRVKHAHVYSGSFLLMTTGLLHGLYQLFAANPVSFPRRVQLGGVPSDQAMLNWYVKNVYRRPVAEWTEMHGFVTYFGAGYERHEHHGVGPNRPTLPPGARIVVLGSADLEVLTDQRYGWVTQHYR